MQNTSVEQKKVIIYTDGACIGNPGRGGYGVVLLFGANRRELSGGFSLTTNNRMEMMAAIAGLEALITRCSVSLYSDSKYLVDAMSKGWVRKWQSKDWWRTKNVQPKNVDLWKRLLNVCDQHEVEFIWVKGHAGDIENERCDTLAQIAANQKTLPADKGYGQPPPQPHKIPKSIKATSNIKVTQEGQPCRNCSTPVIKKIPHKKPKPGQTYRYDYYMYCPSCKTLYMVEDAKRFI